MFILAGKDIFLGALLFSNLLIQITVQKSGTLQVPADPLFLYRATLYLVVLVPDISQFGNGFRFSFGLTKAFQ